MSKSALEKKIRELEERSGVSDEEEDWRKTEKEIVELLRLRDELLGGHSIFELLGPGAELEMAQRIVKELEKEGLLG